MNASASIRRRACWLAVGAGVTILACLFASPYIRCWWLARTASRSASGAMGCGVGFLTLETSRGTVRLRTGLDAIHVFGKVVRVPDLVSLLQERATSNERGYGPMAGRKSALCYVMLDVLGYSGDPSVIEPISKLLTDDSEVVSGWAAIALFRLGTAKPELRPQIQQIAFPPAAVSSAAARGEPKPEWLKPASLPTTGPNHPV